MSKKIPRVPADKIISILKKKKDSPAFRQSGSHKIFRNDSGIRVTVPDHTGKILHPKMVKQICKDAGINPGELS